MKRTTLATLVITILLLFMMIWSFGSSAANSANEQKPDAEQERSSVFAEEDENEPDADLGKFGSRINREEYLEARDEYVARKRGIEPGRPFDPTLRGRAIQQMERQEKNSRLESIISGDLTPAAGGAWSPIGPLTLPNGVGTSTGPTSGRVTAIAINPTSNGQIVYLGTAQGGVWRSLDGGTTWTSIFDNAQTMAIGALAVAPSNPSTLYVGTGEFNSCADCFFGVGLYRIDNAEGAATLNGPINPQQTIGNLTYNVFNGRSITKILVHPTDPATIWVSTARGVGGSGANALSNQLPPLATRGVYRSTTGTSSNPSFQKLTVNTDAGLDSPNTGNADVVDMVMEPGVPDNILVAVIGQQTGLGGIYRTTNATGAATFTQVYSASTTGPPATTAGVRISLAINKVGSVVTAYASTSETPTNTSGCTTANSGAIRKQVDPFNSQATWATQLIGGGGFCSAQCFYDMPIAVDPGNASLVYIGGQTASTCGRLVGKSIDGGDSFISVSSGVHADNHALVFDGAGNIFTGTDGGIWKAATTSSTFTNLNSSPLNTLQFESIAVHPTDQFLMIGGTQDNGTEAQQTSSGNWIRTESGDGGYSLIDQSATNTTDVTMYHTFFNNNTQMGFDRIFKTACIGTGSLFDSWPTRGAGTLGGTNLTPVACDGGTQFGADNGLVLTSTVLFYAPMALGPGSPNTVYFGADRLYRSNDRGDTMTAVSQVPLASPASPISTIAIWKGGDNVRIAGTQNGQVWATSTGSSTMVNITPPTPANPAGGTNRFIGRAMIDPNNKNVAYVTLSYYAPAGQGVWKITNLTAAAGSSPAAAVWQASGSGIPSVPINAFAIDPLNSNNLYAGTDIGVYFSNDAGASWSPFGTALPRVAVFDLQIQPTSRILRAGTHGRGIWETALVNPAASTMQFSTSSVSVTEGTGSQSVDAVVTVTRSGDTTFPATVNYATADSSGANGCTTITGSGSSRCDYIATSGTLNFAAGEPSKQITVPITYDSYAEGGESFTMSLSSPTGLNASVGAPSTTTINISDSGFSGPNQIDNSAFYVREHYVDFLNREPDASGLAFWSNQMTNCSNPPPADLLVCKINVSGAFFLSIEFQQTGYLVERIYKAAFGDGSGTAGGQPIKVPIIRLNQFLPDTQRIGQGVVVGVGNWPQQLDDNKNAFTEEFVQRSAFLTQLPLSMTAAAFVDKLNDNAKDKGNVKPLSQAERDNLVASLNNGTMTRAQVLRAVAEDADLNNSEKNRAFVLMQYFGYLRRNPNDPQDSDYGGYSFWLGKLDENNGDFVAAEMVKAFITSTEYRRRFGLN
jgi:hypothetical protein